MPNLLARLGLGNGGRGVCYGVMASLASALVFCVLVATVSVWKAFLFAGMALTAYGVAQCLTPEDWGAEQTGNASTERETTVGVPVAARRFGLGKATINSLPTFEYGSAEVDGDLECGSAQSCSVCLEDLEDGEMMLPACNHILHVGCIDMWLHSHTTCPVCRCDLSVWRTCNAKVAAVEPEPPVMLSSV